MGDEIAVIDNKLASGITDAESRALSIKVINAVTYTEAGEVRKSTKKMQKTIEEFFKPLKTSAKKAHTDLCTAEKTEIAKLTPSINHLDSEMLAWEKEQARLAKIESDRLAEEARKAAEEEQLRAAAQAEKEGNKEEAEAILNEEVFIPPPVVTPATPKVDGLHSVTYWKFKIVKESDIPREYMKPDEMKIGAHVRSMKDKCNIAGVQPYPETKKR